MVMSKRNWSRRAILTSGLVGVGLARWGKVSAQALTQPKATALRGKLDAIGQSVEAEARAGRATGVSVSVAMDGAIVWEGGFGFAHRATPRPATAHTPFSLASITKTFTTAAVMRLVQVGKLDLDAPIDRYLASPLPRSRFETQRVTLRLLGGHAAGLPTIFEMFDGTRAPSMAELIRDYGELAYPAGERYEYANLGYSLLGAAVSKATGHEFAKSLDDLIIRPLGLRSTFFDTDAARMRTAAGRYDPKDREIPFYTTATPPSGELYASAHDLSIFATSMLGLRHENRAPIFKEEALGALFSPVFTSRTKAFTTFGWAGRDVAGERIIVKTGGQPGVAARLTLLPSRKISIAVIANRDDNRKLVAKISSDIASLLMSDWSDPDLQMDEAGAPEDNANHFAGSWAGSIRNGDKSQSVRISIDAAGTSKCTMGDGAARAIRDLKGHLNTLTFNVEGVLSDVPATDGTMQQIDFKLVARNEDLFGRCLTLCDRPGFTLAEPHIVALSKA